MELETDKRCGAGRHKHSEQRINRRNGYRGVLYRDEDRETDYEDPEVALWQLLPFVPGSAELGARAVAVV